eukprot:scaffold203691_cov17-Tisochrysis_lutea.AAC.1
MLHWECGGCMCVIKNWLWAQGPKLKSAFLLIRFYLASCLPGGKGSSPSWTKNTSSSSSSLLAVPNKAAMQTELWRDLTSVASPNVKSKRASTLASRAIDTHALGTQRCRRPARKCATCVRACKCVRAR